MISYSFAYVLAFSVEYHLNHTEMFLFGLFSFFLKQIIDEKSLIKKYHKEISTLRVELEQLRKGVLVGVSHEELLSLRQQVLTSPRP